MKSIDGNVPDWGGGRNIVMALKTYHLNVNWGELNAPISGLPFFYVPFHFMRMKIMSFKKMPSSIDSLVGDGGISVEK